MAFTDFYIQTTGSDLNSGSTSSDSAAYTSASGNFDGTSVFTPADGSTPSSSVNVGDWAAIYADGATILAALAQVTAVGAGVNGTITLSTTAKLGTFPSSGTGTRTIKVGGAWASPSPVMSGSLGNNTAVPVPMKVNIKAGTYTRTASDTFQLKGTTANQVWFDGYNTTPGDLDADETNSLAKPLISYNAGFRLTFNADYQSVSNLSFLGNVSNAVVTGPFGNAFRFWRCRVENTSSNANAGAFNNATIYCVVAYCWFKAPTTATSNGVCKTSAGGLFYGCVAVGGGKAGFEMTSSSANTIINCVSQGSAGVGIIVSSGTGTAVIIGNTVQNPTGDGIQFASSSSTNASVVFGNLIIGAGGVGLKQTASQTTGHISACNDYYNNTGGNTTGLGDIGELFQQTEVSDPVTSASDPTLVSGANARSNGFPGVFENLTALSYLSAGAAQPNPSAGSGAGGGSYPFVG